MVYDFGYRLSELRRQKRLTQAQVANRLGLSPASISGYENNIKTPPPDILARLALLYGVSTDYLLGLDNREMLCLEGLTDSQKQILCALVKEFRSESGLPEHSEQ